MFFSSSLPSSKPTPNPRLFFISSSFFFPHLFLQAHPHQTHASSTACSRPSQAETDRNTQPRPRTATHKPDQDRNTQPRSRTATPSPDQIGTSWRKWRTELQQEHRERKKKRKEKKKNPENERKRKKLIKDQFKQFFIRTQSEQQLFICEKLL